MERSKKFEKLSLEKKRFNPEKFLAFRNETSKKINDYICKPYYQNQIDISDVQKILSLSYKEIRLISFVLDSFAQPKIPEKIKRKDGSYLATHSLQLFLTARDFYKIYNNDLYSVLLLHDIVEDTQKTINDIGLNFGKKLEKLIGIITEERETKEKSQENRIKEVVEFTKKILKGGEIIALAEIIDRIDDISDLAYLLKPLERDPQNKELKKEVKRKLITKFAKCLYTVGKVKRNLSPKNQKISNDFINLLKYQCQDIKTKYSISINPQELKEEIKKYSYFEKK